ncbi:MAG: putative glycoside hydrolase [Chloroflexia bacterium]
MRNPVSQVRGGLYAPLTLILMGLLALLLAGCSLGPLSFGGTPSAGTPSAQGGAASGSTTTGTTGATAQAPQPTDTPAKRAITGKVVDSVTSQPIANAEVTAGGILTETTTDGQFWFDALPLSVKITANAEGYAPLDLDPGSSSAVEIKLRPNSLSGRVTDAKTGKPLAGVLVKLVKPATPQAPAMPAVTNTEVTTGTTPAAPTTSTLFLSKALAAPEAASLFASDTETPAASDNASSDSNTPTEVPDTSTPVPPTATPTPKPVPPTGPDFVAVYTDDNGSYFFKDVPPGASLTFKMPGYKLTKVAAIDGPKKDMALEEFKPEAVYITAPVAATKSIYDKLLAFIATSRVNAVVLNVQNDNSEWVFDTKNKDAIDANNTDVFLPNMPDIVKDLKNRGLYVIARIVTFQEPTMAKARLDMAVKSSVTGKAWLGGELNQQAWLDASRPAVQDHLVDMTKEVLQLGFDEIQYDYVRFPSDPAPKEPGRPVFSEPMTDTTKAMAIGQFLSKAHAVIEPTDAFMSIDIFGYTLWPDKEGKPMNGVIGQVFEYLVDHTDYVAPMIYPSHFSYGEQGCNKPAQCAYKLVKKSGEYAAQRFEGKKAKYRPWLEDFDWPGADYTSPGTTKVAEQIQAATETNAWGWMWWDAANEYQPRAAFKK